MYYHLSVKLQARRTGGKKRLFIADSDGLAEKVYSEKTSLVCETLTKLRQQQSFCVPGSGTLCASWQCLEVPRGPPPSLAVQFVGSGTSLSGMDVELVGSRYRMSLVKKRFATGDAVNTRT